MMNKKRTRAIGRTKYLMFLPLAALLMIVSNIEAVARATQQMADEVLKPGEATPMQSQSENGILQPQQERTEKVTYKGKVVDKYGQPIEGVQIVTLSQDKSVGYKLLNERSQVDGTFIFQAAPDDQIGFFHVTSEGTYIKSVKPEEWSLSREKTIVMDGEPTPMFRDENKNIPDDEIFEVVENMPQFPNGGMSGLMKYLSENIRYPEAAYKAGTQGRVTVQFVVAKDGSIGHVKIIRGVDPALDAEAMRVISGMPNWKPGTQKGKPVNVKYTVPVMFRLSTGPVDKINETVVVASKEAAASTTGEVYEVADKMPEFPGGMAGLMQYLSKNVKYPTEAHTKGIQGRVIVSVIINTEGKVTNAQIVQGVAPSLDAEALRVTGIMPNWKPGSKDGKPVNVKYTFPIMFRLQ